jgi:hypothetical protein
MIDKISVKFKDNPAYDTILKEIKSKEDIKVKSDNEFTSLYTEQKESTKEITQYQVLLKEDNSIVLNTLFAIINNKEKSIVNSSLIEEYNSYGVMIKKEYKLYNTKTIDKEISDSEALKVSKESIDINTDTYDNYDYIEKLERHFFDTGYLFIRDKLNNKTYKSEVLLDDQKGLQKMYQIINNYRKQEINPITQEEIENKLNKETNDKVKANLKQMSQGREKYSYKSEYDKEYISQGYNNSIKNNTKKIVSLSIAVFVLLISIVYALFTQNLNTKGTGINRKSNFDIYFNNVSDFQTTGTASVVTPNPKVREHTTIIEDYEATLITPSDSIYFTFDIVNDGDYDATLTSLTLGPVTCSVNGDETDTSARNVCENIEYTMKYTDNNQNVSTNDKLLSKETKSVKVTLTYKDTISADKLPTSNVSISNLGIELVYEADTTAKTKNDGSTPYYQIGEELTVKNEKYNIIGIGTDYLTLLKQEPLTVAEVNTYGGVGTDDNRVNKYTGSSVGEAYNINGYGGIAYYSSPTCGYMYIEGVRQSLVDNGCLRDYKTSDIKFVVDNWINDIFVLGDLKEINGYKARLIEKEELISNFYPRCGPYAKSCDKENDTPSWLYNIKYEYWTMTKWPFYNYTWLMWTVSRSGSLSQGSSYAGSYLVRPVINIYKSKL